MKRAILPATWIIFLLSMVAPAAQAADLPACPADFVRVNFGGDVTTQAIVGKSYTAFVYPNTQAEPATISVDGASGPIAHPYSAEIAPYTSSTKRIEVPIRLEQGDGPATLRVTYVTTAYSADFKSSYKCGGVQERTITPVPVPDCSTVNSYHHSYSVSAPAGVAAGRPAEVEVTSLSDYGSPSPPVVTVNGIVVGSAPGMYKLAPSAARPAEYSVVWTEDDGGCKTSIDGSVGIVRGTVPRISRSVVYDKSAVLTVRVPRACGTAATGRLTLTVSTRGTSKVLTKSDQCRAGWKGKPRSLHGWTIASRNGGRVYFAPTVKRNLRQLFRYRLTFKGKVIAHGGVIARTTYEPGLRIYDTNFDAYVNVCINGSYDTYASGGRLYCWVPSTLTRTFKFVK